MKKLLLTFALVAIALCANAAKVVYAPGGTLTYTESTDAGDIKIIFKKCMQNNLYTFYQVSLNNRVVNQTGSDNIGPFLAGGSWMGGNHNNPQGGSTPSADTVEIIVTADGDTVKIGDTFNDIDVLKIEVANEIFYQNGSGTRLGKFCDEKMTYIVSGNSIDVTGEHHFQYPSKLNVDRYYGAQSMFPATELLLPGTDDKTWIKLPSYEKNAERKLWKSKHPEFSTFVEKSAYGYQAVYKYPEGMGDASLISSDGPVFIWAEYGGATGKSYHVMMWHHDVENGDKTTWHALYSWFKQPVTDSFRTEADEPVFEYQATVNGENKLMHIGADGKMESSNTSGIEDISIDNSVESNAPAAYYNIQGVKVDNPSTGLYIVRQANGKTTKALIR